MFAGFYKAWNETAARLSRAWVAFKTTPEPKPEPVKVRGIMYYVLPEGEDTTKWSDNPQGHLYAKIVYLDNGLIILITTIENDAVFEFVFDSYMKEVFASHRLTLGLLPHIQVVIADHINQ